MKTVLVVDDEMDIVSAVRSILESEGYSVITAVNGALALEAMRASRPDCAIVDLMMPVMDGLELMRVAKADEALRKIPIVLMSAADPRGKQEDYGWVAFLHKPFRISALLRAIEQAVGPKGSI